MIAASVHSSAVQPVARRDRRRFSSACSSAFSSACSVPTFGVAVKPLADAFLRLIKMIIAPLLFCDARRRHRGHRRPEVDGPDRPQGDRLFRGGDDDRAVHRAGAGEHLQAGRRPGACRFGADTSAAQAMVQNQQHAWDIFLHLFPTSVIDAMARGDILQLVVFSMFFGDRGGGDRREGPADSRRPRQHRARDVQGHRLRDGVRADRRLRRDCRDGRRARASRSSSRSAS